MCMWDLHGVVADHNASLVLQGGGFYNMAGKSALVLFAKAPPPPPPPAKGARTAPAAAAGIPRRPVPA